MSQKITLTAPPWALSIDDVLEELRTNAATGLTSAEAAKRLQLYGKNEIPEPEPDPLWKRYWGQLTGDAVVRLLLLGGILSLILQDWLEGIAIVIMLNIMAAFGLWQEGRATDAARSLRRADAPSKLVYRDGKRQDIQIADIVVGDVIYLPTGSVAPADGRIIASVNAEKDASQLTGEALPISLELEPLHSTTIVNSQANMLHRGNGVVAGNATMVVSATGGETEIGKIAIIIGETDEVATPLDNQLDELGNVMTKVFLWIAAIVIGVGTLREFISLNQANIPLGFLEIIDILKEAFINAVALIIAAIPEGLPAVLTITLAIATRVMVTRNALVRRPKAVEGGGSMNVLLTDKTGTLTANQMAVTNLYINGRTYSSDQIPPEITNDPVFVRAVKITKLCNNNSSATEAALLRWVDQGGFDVVGGLPRQVEHEFDSARKRMTTLYPHDSHESGVSHILTKGAPEQVLEMCSSIQLNGRELPLTNEHRQQTEKAMSALAMQGLRVIALADRLASNGAQLGREDAERDLTFIGLLGIMDPPRSDVAPAIKSLAGAGIRTIMVTGDNHLTAYQVARMVGIIEQDMPLDQAVITGHDLDENLAHPDPRFLQRLNTVRVFARVTPQHKSQIVEAMQEQGFIVGMTGDGVNDAIALKGSDVGFAMGNGTDVAREASDVVLTDSRFSTIPNAVEEGRNVIHRIRLYLSYILSGNGCEVGAFIVAYAIGMPIPLTALALLVINFATDSFPALAMAFEPGESNVMTQTPRKREEPFMTRVMWIHIAVQTIVATIIIMGVYYYCLNVLGTSLELARAAAFMTYISQKLYRAFTARSLIRNVWEIGFFQNKWSIGAVIVSLAIAVFFVWVPVVNDAMGMTGLDLNLILLVILVGLIPPVAEEVTKLFLKKNTMQSVSPQIVSK